MRKGDYEEGGGSGGGEGCSLQWSGVGYVVSDIDFKWITEIILMHCRPGIVKNGIAEAFLRGL